MREGVFFSDVDISVQALVDNWAGVAEISVDFMAVPPDAPKVQNITLPDQAAGAMWLAVKLQRVLTDTRMMVSELDSNKILAFTVNEARQLVRAQQSAIFLLSEDGQYLELTASSLLRHVITDCLQLAVKGCLAEVALRDRRVQISNAAAQDTLVKPIANVLSATRLEALLCVPLIFQQDNLGVLVMWHTGEEKFSQTDGRLISLFAAQAALALHNVRSYEHNQESAIIQERHRLARDLHDSVTQALYSIGLAAQTATRWLDQTQYTQVRDPLEYIQALSQTALAEIRETLYHLYPTSLTDRELVETVTQYCTTLSHQYALSIKFVSTLQQPLLLEQQNALYYIIREALWNVIKHAQATQVEILLKQEHTEVWLTIKDNGMGFDISTLANHNSFGLRNMQERAKQLGGNLHVQSSPGQGTQLTVQFSTQVDL